jgi:hypothetical protein
MTVVPGREACRWRLLGGRYLFGAPTAVLFRSDVVRNRPSFYNEANLHADSEVHFQLLERGDMGFVHQVLTFRRVREESLTSFSTSFNTYLAARLYELVTYGDRYLTAAERQGRLRQSLREYYAYLATQIYQRRGRQFWDYHRTKLAEVGLPLSRARLAAHGALYTLELLLNPLATSKRLGARLARGKAARN